MNSGAVALTVMPPSVPDKLVAPAGDRAQRASIEQSVIAAEKAFSDEAQTIGLGPAFAKYGSADAMNMGGPNDASFVIGAEMIGKSVGASLPTDSSPVSWSAESAIAASSGDLAVTIGYIRANTPAGSSQVQAPIPFFTIWRRASPAAPWRYVAE